MHMCRQRSIEMNQTEFYINTIFISVLSKIKFTKEYSYDNQQNSFSVFWVYGYQDCIMVTIIGAVLLQNWVLHQMIRVSPVGMVNMTT